MYITAPFRIVWALALFCWRFGVLLPLGLALVSVGLLATLCKWLERQHRRHKRRQLLKACRERTLIVSERERTPYTPKEHSVCGPMTLSSGREVILHHRYQCKCSNRAHRAREARID